MIRTVVTPATTDLHINIPNDYVGKKIEVLVFSSNEIKEELLPSKPGIMAQFWGTISKETGEEMQKHIELSRQEWERDI
jgi:hypothetical protein